MTANETIQNANDRRSGHLLQRRARVNLYNAAVKYADFVNAETHGYDEAMRISDELEAAALEFGEAAGDRKPEPSAEASDKHVGPKDVLDITDTDRLNWLEAQQPNTLIVEPGMVTNSLRIAIDEKIKQERRAAVMSNSRTEPRR